MFQITFSVFISSKSHILLIWNVTVILWIFTLWTAYSVDIHSFTLQLHLQTNRLMFLTIEQEMLLIYKQSLSELRVLLLLFYCFLAKGYTIDINLYKVKIVQHKKKYLLCSKFDWQYQNKKKKERSFVCNMLAVVFIERNSDVTPQTFRHAILDTLHAEKVHLRQPAIPVCAIHISKISAYLIHMVPPHFKCKDWNFCCSSSAKSEDTYFDIFFNGPCTWSHMPGFSEDQFNLHDMSFMYSGAGQL